MAERRRPIGVDRLDGVAMVTFASPILALNVLDELISTIDSLAKETEQVPLVLTSDHPGVFLAGAHLAEIASLDADSSGSYADRGRRVVEELESYPAPTIAAVNGSCSGGGFDLVLACDAIVVGARARFSHPGIRRGLITGWSGTTRLPSALGSASGRAAVLETRSIDANSLTHHGAVSRAEGDHLSQAVATARRLASLDPDRRRLWRSLRGPGFIDRFHASVVHKL